MRRSAGRPDIVVLPPVLFGTSMVAGFLLRWLRPIPLLPILPARVLGLALFVLSGLLAHFAHTAMQRAGTNIFPTKPALALVTEGPFRYTRNPIYLAGLGVCLGVSLWIDGLAPVFLLVPMVCVLHWGIVLREERYLEAKFGDAYRAYRTRVQRWL